MQKPDEISIYQDAFQTISLVLGGAAALFEDEGQRICEKLDQEELGRLKCAMLCMGKAIAMAKDRADMILLHDTLY